MSRSLAQLGSLKRIAVKRVVDSLSKECDGLRKKVASMTIEQSHLRARVKIMGNVIEEYRKEARASKTALLQNQIGAPRPVQVRKRSKGRMANESISNAT